MAAAIVQSKSAQGSGGSVAVTFDSAVTAGNAVIVLATAFSSTAPSAASDNKSNTYTRHVSGASNISVAIFSALNVTGGSSFQVTVTGSSDVSAAIFEVSGLATSAAFDVSATNGGTSASHSTGTTAATAQADAIAFAVTGHDGVSTADPTLPGGSAYTLGPFQTNTALMPLASAYQVLSATGTQTATISWINAGYFAGIAVFKAAGGAPAAEVGTLTPMRGVVGP